MDKDQAKYIGESEQRALDTCRIAVNALIPAITSIVEGAFRMGFLRGTCVGCEERIKLLESITKDDGESKSEPSPPKPDAKIAGESS